jgi:hypothetical protein
MMRVASPSVQCREAPLSSRQGASTQSQRRNVPVLAYVGHFLPRVFVCNLRRGWWALLRQRLAQLSFGTLVLLPTGTIYRGTQRNTIGLSVCNGCLPWGLRSFASLRMTSLTVSRLPREHCYGSRLTGGCQDGMLEICRKQKPSV